MAISTNLGDEIMQVQLPKDYQDELYNSIKELLMNVVEDTQKQTAINTPWLKGKKSACKWLGVSDQTLGKLLKAGLPVHFVDGLESVHFFNKAEITQFLLKQ